MHNENRANGWQKLNGVNLMESIRVFRIKEVARITGLSESTIRRYEKENIFPRRIQITSGTKVWLESDVECWIKSNFSRGIN